MLLSNNTTNLTLAMFVYQTYREISNIESGDYD